MKYALLQWLACPACGSRDLRLETRRTEASTAWRGQLPDDTPGYDPGSGELVEVADGEIGCGGCGQAYPVVEGIPRMIAGGSGVARSAHTTTSFDASAPEWEQEFLDFARPLGPEDFLGRLVLDAGCGFGRGAYFAARYGAEVVGVDADPAILAAAKDNIRRYARVHLVQADAMALPFPVSVFDLVYAFGLLHHLQDATSGFRELAARVKSGGRLSVWVYGPRQGTAAALSAALRGMTRDMPSDELLNVSRTIASVLRVASHTPYRLSRHLPGMNALASHLPLHDHHRWPYDVVVADVYDRLRIPVTRTFTSEELEVLYVDAGFLDVQTSRRVRNNESWRATGIRR